jgi:hypothetical protein
MSWNSPIFNYIDSKPSKSYIKEDLIIDVPRIVYCEENGCFYRWKQGKFEVAPDSDAYIEEEQFLSPTNQNDKPKGYFQKTTPSIVAAGGTTSREEAFNFGLYNMSFSVSGPAPINSNTFIICDVSAFFRRSDGATYGLSFQSLHGTVYAATTSTPIISSTGTWEDPITIVADASSVSAYIPEGYGSPWISRYTLIKFTKAL